MASQQDGIEIGARVYAESNGNNRDWHWAIVTDVKRNSTGSTHDQYSLLFDDGYATDVACRKQFVTVAKYREIFAGDAPPIPPDHVVDVEKRHAERREQQSCCIEDERPCKQQKLDTNKSKTITTMNHFLVGRKFCLAWQDLEGRRVEVDGTVIECVKDGDEILSFRVKYSDSSRDVDKSISNECEFGMVPEFQMLPPPLVLGGCIRHEQQTTGKSVLLNDIGHLVHYWDWITPNYRHEELVENGFPRLTLHVRGFCLEFNVRPSTIPNAGNGVFLKCSRLEMNGNSTETKPSFQLKAGELVDLGVYAPFRKQDKKLEAVFFCKNFVYSHKCQEWAFNAGDSRFHLDITDDFTGDIHTLAMKHIPAYVNESEKDAAVCIRAEHSPDSSVHYLLGHAYKTQGSFTVPSDGREREAFVNYGKDYEEVRVRKGYSFLRDKDKKEHLLNVIAQEDVVDVKEMDGFGLTEIQACVSFFSGLFSSVNESKFTKETIQRALTCMAVLHRRAWRIFLEENDEHDDSSVESSNVASKKQVLEQASAPVVGMLLDKLGDERIELKALHVAGDVDELFRRVLKLQFSNDELQKLADMMK